MPACTTFLNLSVQSVCSVEKAAPLGCACSLEDAAVIGCVCSVKDAVLLGCACSLEDIALMGKPGSPHPARRTRKRALNRIFGKGEYIT